MRYGVMDVNDNLLNNKYYIDTYQEGLILREFFNEFLFRSYYHGITSFSNPKYSNLTTIEFGIWKRGVWTRTHIDRTTHVGIQTYDFSTSTMQLIDPDYTILINNRKVGRRSPLMFVIYPISRLEGKINKDIIRETFRDDYAKWKREHDEFPKIIYPTECIPPEVKVEGA